MGKPFDVEIDCGAATSVTFTLDEQRPAKCEIHGYKRRLRTKSADDRTRLWNAALTVGRTLIKMSDGGPIEVYDGPDAWIIPERSVRWVRIHDPESPDQRSKRLGFRIGSSDD
jgi:hypothetical protein